MKLSDAVGFTPENAVNDYAVRLSDTEFGQYYEPLKLLSKDTYLCIRIPGALSLKGENSEQFKQAKATLKAILEFKAPED